MSMAWVSWVIMFLMVGGLAMLLLGGMLIRTLLTTRAALDSKDVPGDITLACPHCGQQTRASLLDCEVCGESLAGGP